MSAKKSVARRSRNVESFTRNACTENTFTTKEEKFASGIIRHFKLMEEERQGLPATTPAVLPLRLTTASTMRWISP